MKNWSEFLEAEKKEEYFTSLMQKVNEAYEKGPVYPPKEEMFSCFDLCPYPNTKAVIIGQDPYHRANQAHGLSFSVKPDVKIPPSLKNIYKELKTDLNIDPPSHGYLASWAQQGVLMMNTSWTVNEGQAGSHKKLGWTKFTQRVLQVLNGHEQPLVFLLWGNHAIEAASGIDNPKHLLLKSPHPSPLAGGGFFGSRPFSQANEFLEKEGRGAIDWRISD
ncbi:uracil-DNA glycosylase [Chryseobacterium sp. CT-SW4]|uniref:uracil-DNA glycosylase n=1 Tax=Chryseobacterium sp. SW-1 TaxID=3157343 RepID=UPI003B021847